ncbi:MAG TPA: hypothetical protein RMG48_21670 [Myxococcales bacterium LLY-WYZ-16_1]|nr:hypothetical protein [Myxococcales bacterium LLY-WYZ-16_1]
MAEVARPFERAVLSVERATRALSYYSPEHPVFLQHLEDAFRQVTAVLQEASVLTLGGGGSQLLFHPDAAGLSDGPARVLAHRLFELSVAGIRFERGLGEDGFSRLLVGLAHSPARIRAQGGLAAVVGPARGLTVMEVDFDRIFRGEVENLSEFVGEDAVAEAALKALLRWRDSREEGGAGDELVVEQEAVRTPRALGDFLEDLLAKAEPGTVQASGSARSSPVGRALGAGEVAELAHRAFWSHHRSAAARASDPAGLAAAADHLSSTLVRLAPPARFALLRRLAGQEEDPEDPVAVRRVAERLGDDAIVEAVAAALSDPGQGDGLARSIGDLIRRMRPVQGERNRLLERLERGTAGIRSGGVLWQELRSRALDQPGLGLLELQSDQVLPGLLRAARKRRQGALSPVWGQDVLFSADDRAIEAFEHTVVLSLLLQPDRCPEGVVRRAGELASSFEASRASDEWSELVHGISMRARADGFESPAGRLTEALFAGEPGGRRAFALLKRKNEVRVPTVLLSALSAKPSREVAEKLTLMLAESEERDLTDAMHRAARSDQWFAVRSLVRASTLRGGSSGAAVARVALTEGGVKTKEVALKSLSEHPAIETSNLLAQAAGVGGERKQLHVLGLAAGDRNLARLRRAAIGALGLSRVPAAAQALGDLLFSTKLFGSREDEEIRLCAAQALVTNGTDLARQLLRDGSRHRKRTIREVCTRVWGTS